MMIQSVFISQTHSYETWVSSSTFVNILFSLYFHRTVLSIAWSNEFYFRCCDGNGGTSQDVFPVRNPESHSMKITFCIFHYWITLKGRPLLFHCIKWAKRVQLWHSNEWLVIMGNFSPLVIQFQWHILLLWNTFKALCHIKSSKAVFFLCWGCQISSPRKQ